MYLLVLFLVSFVFLLNNNLFHNLKNISDKVSTHYQIVKKSGFSIKQIVYSLYVIVKLFVIYNWNNFLQNHFYTNVTNAGKNMYDIKFVINSKSYKFRIKTKRGPSKLLYAEEGDKDVTHILEPYANASDVTFVPLTLDDLGLVYVEAELSDGTNKKISNKDIIKF